MIYELADHVQGFLSEHNKPLSSSFHEEMLKDQRLQQERLALEEQEKLDQRRRQEEQTVRMHACLYTHCTHARTHTLTDLLNVPLNSFLSKAI